MLKIPNPHALAHIHAACFPRGWSAEEFARLLAQPGVFCIEEEAAFILCRTVVDECEILTFAVHPSQQRRGLGTHLLNLAMLRAAQEETHTMFLEVAADNTTALALYQKAGFTEISRRRGYYASGADAVVMERVIRGS